MDDSRDLQHQAVAFDYLESILSICNSRTGNETSDDLWKLMDHVASIARIAEEKARHTDLAKVYWDHQHALVKFVSNVASDETITYSKEASELLQSLDVSGS